MTPSISNISSTVIIFSLLICSSCLKKNQEEIKRTDSLIVMLDSSEKIFLSFDTMRVQNILDSTDHKVELLKKFTPDSLDKETTILLADYIHIHMALEKYPADRKNILSQISFSRKQLKDMKHDLSNVTMSKEEFTKNFSGEQKAISELCSYMNMNSSKTNLLAAQYDFIRAKVDSFIVTLDTTRENENKNMNLNLENMDTD